MTIGIENMGDMVITYLSILVINSNLSIFIIYKNGPSIIVIMVQV